MVVSRVVAGGMYTLSPSPAGIRQNQDLESAPVARASALDTSRLTDEALAKSELQGDDTLAQSSLR